MLLGQAQGSPGLLEVFWVHVKVGFAQASARAVVGLVNQAAASEVGTIPGVTNLPENFRVIASITDRVTTNAASVANLGTQSAH